MRRSGWTLLTAIVAILFSGESRAVEPTPEQVRLAIQRGARYILRQQQPDGSWAERHQPGGVTALATFALLAAEEPRDAPHMKAALLALDQIKPATTYVVSMKLMALVQDDPRRHRRAIRELAEWLIAAQTPAGLWSYTRSGGRWDHSNSQFALLALHAAQESGVRVREQVWRSARDRVIASQVADGGWAYQEGGQSYGSMTAANVANLVILDSTISIGLERGFRNGVAPRCGEYRLNRPLANGIRWLSNEFSPRENPRRGGAWKYYWLYAAERAGILTGRRYFGQHDWYRDGSAELIRRQNVDGSWGGRLDAGDLVDTAFALLFLAKGRTPLLIQKLQWSDDEAWNPDRHDVENLLEFIGDRLGRKAAWQVIDFNAPLEDWLAAPLLYMQGHDFPRWNEPQRTKVREFLEQGGTLLAEACCGREQFRKGFMDFAASTFPHHPLRPLDVGHSVFSAHFEVEPRELWGLELGCRTSVIFSPHDLSCLWEQRNVPRLSQEAFELGTNVAAFALGRQALRDRLDVVTLAERAGEQASAPAGDAIRIGQVVYSGDWRPDPHSLNHFAEFLTAHSPVRISAVPLPVRLDEAALATTPLLYLTGHYPLELSAAEKDALRNYLRRGGFLFADACCGRPTFDVSFRSLMFELFPDERLTPLSREHAIFRGRPGFTLDRVGYKPAALAEASGRDQPELMGVSLSGRLAVVYSPYAIGCGLEGHACADCRGLVDEDARRLATNVLLYAVMN